MNISLAPYLQLNLDFYENYGNFVLSSMHSVSKLTNRIKQRNIKLLNDRLNINFKINEEDNILMISNDQFNQARSQFNSDLSEMMDEISIIHKENTTFLKKYVGASNKVLADLVIVSVQQIKFEIKEKK